LLQKLGYPPDKQRKAIDVLASEVLPTACSIAPTSSSMLALTLVTMFAGFTLINAQIGIMLSACWTAQRVPLSNVSPSA
jgi:hypothetical protein